MDADGLQDGNMPTAVFMDKIELNGIKSPFFFRTDGFLNGRGNPTCRIVPGKTFGAATIACRAMQFACQMGARRIFLCGIDMFGSKYFDGSDVAQKFMTERKNAKWGSQIKAFNGIIAFAWDEMGIPTYSLSKTALNVQNTPPKTPVSTQKVDKLPTFYANTASLPSVAYLTMTLSQRSTMNVLAWCAAQDYPDELKTIYLMHQEPYPGKLIHDLPFKVREYNVPGVWRQGLWAKKLYAFSEVVKEDIMMIFDEDDCWMPDYTQTAIKPLLDQDKYDFAWCYDMQFVESLYDIGGLARQYSTFEKLPEGGQWRPGAMMKRHQSAIGTLVARVPGFLDVIAHFKRLHPDGMAEIAGGTRAGPIDNYFRRLLQGTYKDRLTEHQATGRWYHIHTGASSRHGRRKEGYIDG